MKRMIGLLAGVALTGCCEEKTQTVEVEFNSPYYEIQQKILSGYRNSWDCDGGRAIRNGFGTTIGYTYTCTKCE